MKTLSQIAHVGAVLLIGLTLGCTQKSDPRIAQLETEVKRLEATCQQQRAELLRLSGNFSGYTNFSQSNMQCLSTELLGQHDLMTSRQSAFEKFTNSLLAPQAGWLTNGIPVAVYHQMLQAAMRNWPGDSRMQEYAVRTEMEAYHKSRD